MKKGLIRVKPELMRELMRNKDVWFLRAMILAARLRRHGINSQDVLDVKEKSDLYKMLEIEK